MIGIPKRRYWALQNKGRGLLNQPVEKRIKFQAKNRLLWTAEIKKKKKPRYWRGFCASLIHY